MLVVPWSLFIGASTGILQHSPSWPLSDETGGWCVHHKRSGLSHLEGTVNAKWNEDIALWQLFYQQVACVCPYRCGQLRGSGMEVKLN